MQNTILALFNQRVEAERAREDLLHAGLALSHVEIVSAGQTPSGNFAQPSKQESAGSGLLGWLFGSGDIPRAEAERYHSYVNEGGKTLLSVRATNANTEFERIVNILDQHNPIEIGEEPTPQEQSPTISAAGGEATAAELPAGTSETVIPTAREEMQVGKREATDTRRYRVRRYAVERPVEEQVTLRDETVTVERRPPSGEVVHAGELSFEENEVEITERREEPVVAKVVRPGDEVVVRKDVSDRVETIRGTVRETKVDVDRAAAGDKPSLTQTGAEGARPANADPLVDFGKKE